MSDVTSLLSVVAFTMTRGFVVASGDADAPYGLNGVDGFSTFISSLTPKKAFEW